ncbi:MAG: macro domain-containing protein [Rhodomicrobium sp.]|nr:macro domain-containing protein [Rhodomicrobium sp.]
MSMQWLEVVEGDITKIEADAIVNAANSDLAMGGGVCGAIFRAAGSKDLSEACRAAGHCPTGSAVITPAFGIKTAKFIIHAVGPVYSRYPVQEAQALLRSAYRTSIRLAKSNGCEISPRRGLRGSSRRLRRGGCSGAHAYQTRGVRCQNRRLLEEALQGNSGLVSAETGLPSLRAKRSNPAPSL